MGLAYHHMGQYEQSIATFNRRSRVVNDERFKYERFGTAIVISVICRSWLTQCFAQLGHFKDGNTLAEDAIRLPKRASMRTASPMRTVAWDFYFSSREISNKRLEPWKQAKRSAKSSEIRVLTPHIGSNLAYAYALAGRVDDAIPLMEKADEQSRLIGRKAAWALRLTWLGHASLLGRQIDTAREQGNARWL